MQVAVVAPDDLPIPPVKGGSVQIYLWHVCRLLAGARDVTVTLLSPGRHPSPELSSHLPVAVRNRRERRRTYRALILTELKQIGPDIVHVDNRPDLVPAVRVACPDAKVVLNLHSGTFLGPRHLAPTAARDILCSADAVVCNSRFLQRRIARHFRLETGAWHPVVIYPGVDVAQFTPLAAAGHAQNGRASPVLSTGRPVRPEGLRVLYVGRVIQGKGVHVLVEAVRQLRRRGVPVTLTIVGRTPPWEAAYARRLRRMASGLAVDWAGFVPPDQLARYYHAADVFVCPSQAPEAFGLVNLEAMAAGLPVVASRQGGIPEVVTPDAGVLVTRFRDPAAFANALRDLAARPLRWRQLRRGARQRARQFTWQRTANAWADLYRSVYSER